MQDGAPVTSAGRKLERVSNGAPRGMAATRVASSDVARAQNPAYRPALPPDKKMPASFGTPAFLFGAPSSVLHAPRHRVRRASTRDDFERMRQFGCFRDHDRRRAVFV